MAHSDINLRGVVITSVALVVVAVVVHVLMLVLFWYFASREARETERRYPLAGVETPLPPQPRIQADPAEDEKNLRLRDEAILTTYSWVDRPAGIVRIPIDRAMKLVLERGLPIRPGETAGSTSGPSDASGGLEMERTK